MSADPLYAPIQNFGYCTDSNSYYDCAVMSFDPAYSAIEGYANEWNDVNNNCSGLQTFQDATQAVLGVAGTASIAVFGAQSFGESRFGQQAMQEIQANPERGSIGGSGLKGPIPDAVPETLPQQMALDAAKQGAGTQIMENLGDEPRLIANYGPGRWVKMQYVLRSNYSNVRVHYFRNLDLNLDVEFKFV